jgi:hypothetical protein
MWIDIEPILPIETYIQICDELFDIAKQNILGSEASSPKIDSDSSNSDVAIQHAARRVVAQTPAGASVGGHSNNVTRTQLHELHLSFCETENILRNKDDENGETVTHGNHQFYHLSGIPRVSRIHKDKILDPIPDNDYIDYNKNDRPWEDNKLENKELISNIQFGENSYK